MRGVMILHNVVGVTCKIGRNTHINVQVPSKWAKECMLDNCD